MSKWKANRYKVDDGMHIVGRNVAEILRQVGFHDKCFHYYDSDGKLTRAYTEGPKNHNGLYPWKSEHRRVSAPTFAQVEEYFITKWGIIIHSNGKTITGRKPLTRYHRKRKKAMEEVLEMDEFKPCGFDDFQLMCMEEGYIPTPIDETKLLKSKGLNFPSVVQMRNVYHRDYGEKEGFGPMESFYSFDVRPVDYLWEEKYPDYRKFMSIGGFSFTNYYDALSDIFMYLSRNLIRYCVHRPYKI